MRQRREYCGEGFAGGLCGIDVLLLEVDADTERLQFSHGLQTFFGVACEARGGFDKNTVNAAAAAIFHHPQEVIPLFDGCAGDTLIGIVKNEALMILRRKQKELPQEDWDNFSADVNDPIGYNELVQLFSRLPPTYRAVLEMRMINDYSGKEIAVHLGISESAVNTRISRGRILLRELAVKEGFHV